MKAQLSPTESHYHNSIHVSLFSWTKTKMIILFFLPGVALIWPTRLSWASIFSTLFLVPEYPEQGIQPMLDVSNRRTTVIRKNLQITLSIQYNTRPHGAREANCNNNLEKQNSLCSFSLFVCVLCFIFCVFFSLVF